MTAQQTTPLGDVDAEYDLIVVGGGGSGLSAALQAARNGLSVAVLEKMPEVGGSSALAEGHAAFETDEQEKRGIRVTKDDAFRRYMEYSHWRADPALVTRFVENAAATIDKLRGEGVVYEAVKVTAGDQPDEVYTWHIPEGEIARVIEILERSARAEGVDIFLETSVEQLLMADGRVAGVAARDSSGEAVRLGAKAVVIATGGFAGNPEMLDEWSQFDCGEKMIHIGNEGNTGDGLRMMFDVGAQPFRSMGTVLLAPFMRDKTATSHTNTAGFQPYLWVDAHGRRFTNEICGLNFGHAGEVIAFQPEAFAWTILDQAQVDHLVNDGCEVGLGEFVLTGAQLVNLPEELAADVEAGRTAFSAETLEGLAREIGVDAETFTAEVAEYNEYCRRGEDPRFRKQKYLLPVEEAPFYALKMEPGILISMGGVAINADMQVLGADQEPIPGLYSVGCDAGGLFGESYTLTVPGTGNGFALTSGWLAADHATEMIKQQETV